MHALLIERGQIIDRLIEIKRAPGRRLGVPAGARGGDDARASSSATRGHLPLDTVEGIWRVIISTFTYVQAPYSVHVDVSRGDAAMRDSARFHFGFTVALRAASWRGGGDRRGRATRPAISACSRSTAARRRAPGGCGWRGPTRPR